MPNYSILVIEDDFDQQFLIRKFLEKEGFKVTFSEKVDQGLENLAHNQFDAILIDYMLPEGSNGLSALKEIRKENSSITAIIMTAYGTQELAIEAIRNQSDDFLVKPIDYSKLGSILSERIKKRDMLFPKPEKDFDVRNYQEFNPFENFVILRGSIPIFMKGQWSENANDLQPEGISDNTLLLSGFLSAMQSFSSSIFGMSMSEISFGEWKIMFQQQDPFLCAIKVKNQNYNIIAQKENKRTIINSLSTILASVAGSNPVSELQKNVVSIIESKIDSAKKQINTAKIPKLNRQVTIASNSLPNKAEDVKIVNKKGYFSKLKDNLKKHRSGQNSRRGQF